MSGPRTDRLSGWLWRFASGVYMLNGMLWLENYVYKLYEIGSTAKRLPMAVGQLFHEYHESEFCSLSWLEIVGVVRRDWVS